MILSNKIPSNWRISNVLVNYISWQVLLPVFRNFFKGVVLDVGCGVKPYKYWIAQSTRKYFGIDAPTTLHGNREIDALAIAIAYNLPFKSGSFDSVLSTAVLEHLEEPTIFFQEAYRVIKDNGYLVMTVPFIWHLHEEPRNFFRYSQYGIEHLLKKSHFTPIEIRPLAGFCVTFGAELSCILYSLHRGILRFIPIIPVVVLLVQIAAFLLDKIYKTRKWTWAYLVIAQRRDNSDCMHS